MGGFAQQCTLHVSSEVTIRPLALILLLSILPNVQSQFGLFPMPGSRPATPKPSQSGQEYANIFAELQVSDEPLIQKIIAVEKRVCGNVCGPHFPNGAPRISEYSACESCQCEAICVLYENCCPDVVFLRNITYQNQAECARLSPTEEILVGNSIYDYNLGIYSSLITKCPQAHFYFNVSSALIHHRKCEYPDFTKPDESLPVSDISTNLSYTNVYCARCHRVRPTNIHEWSIELSCNNPGNLFDSMPNKTELYEKLSSRAGVKSTGCELTYISDAENKYRRSCQQKIEPLISQCREEYRTSPHYNEDIEKACHLYTSNFGHGYKNMFCYMCNNHPRTWTLSLLDQYVLRIGAWISTVNLARLSFSSLIDFRDDHGYDAFAQRSVDVVTIECSSSQFYDNVTCSCRDIQCDQWRTFEPETRTCPGGIGSIGVGFQACLRAFVDFDTPPAVTMVQRLSQEFESLEPTHKMIMTVSEWCPMDKRMVILLESSAIEEDVEETRHAHEYYEKTFNKDGAIFCHFLEEELEMKSDVYGNNKLESCAFDMVDTIECSAFNDFSLSCPHSDVAPIKQTDVTNTTSLGEKYDKRIPSGNFGFGGPPSVKVNRNKNIVFFPYIRTDHCSFVDIPAAEFSEKENALRHSLSLRDIEKVGVQFKRNNSIITVCFTDYLEWTKNYTSYCGNKKEYYSDISFDTWTISGLISIISSCISLFFLLLTFLTYVLFDELRTKGCVNLMVLTVILFIAQALYEFAIEQYENKILCSIFGVLIHYFWLASIFSMNACTIERFVKLYFPLESRSLFLTNKPLIMATLYTVLCPLLIIAGNIAANIVFTNQFGYGSSQICYINARYSRIFSFVMPMCVILVVNVVLLIVTIVKLSKISLPGGAKGRKSGSRIGLVACVRLSVVTGGTWLISLLYEAIPVEALGYVFTALLGCQGVVFFFSLLGNARILGLYRGLVMSKSGNRSTSSSVRTKSSMIESRSGSRKMANDTSTSG